jgi:hypothetical protein
MFKFSAALSLSIVLGCGLCGCSDEQQPQRHAERRSGLSTIGQADWLTAQDDVMPEVWLIAHESKAVDASSVGDPRVVRRSLAEASTKFNDTPRMIANRAVQLEKMLKGEGVEENAIILINRLNDAIAPGRIESFGAAVEKYYNMRKAGMSSDQALDTLSKRYGSRG